MELDTIPPTLEKQIDAVIPEINVGESPQQAIQINTTDELETITPALRAIKGSLKIIPSSKYQQESQSFMTLISKQLKEREGLVRFLDLIITTELTPLPIDKNNRDLIKLEKTNQEHYEWAKKMASTLKNNLDKPDFEGRFVLAAPLLTEAAALQFTRGKWLEEAYQNQLNNLVENTKTNMVNFLKLYSYGLPVSEVNLKDVSFQAPFNYRLTHDPKSVGVYSPDLAHNKLEGKPSITIMLLLPPEDNWKRIEGTLIHEMFHSATDLTDKLLLRTHDNKFFLLSSTNGHAITGKDITEYKNAITRFNTIKEINTYLQAFNMSLARYHPKDDNLLDERRNNINNATAGRTIGLELPNLDKENTAAFRCLTEALTDFTAFQIRFVIELAQRKQLFENVTEVFLENTFEEKVKTNDIRYYNIGYETETSALVKCAGEYLPHTGIIPLIRGALTVEGLLRLHDKLMEEPKLKGKTGEERLLEFAKLVCAEKIKLDGALKARH